MKLTSLVAASASFAGFVLAIPSALFLLTLAGYGLDLPIPDAVSAASIRMIDHGRHLTPTAIPLGIGGVICGMICGFRGRWSVPSVLAVIVGTAAAMWAAPLTLIMISLGVVVSGIGI